MVMLHLFASKVTNKDAQLLTSLDEFFIFLM